MWEEFQAEKQEVGKSRTQDKVEGEGQQPHRVSTGGTERIATQLRYKGQILLRTRSRPEEKLGRSVHKELVVEFWIQQVSLYLHLLVFTLPLFFN